MCTMILNPQFNGIELSFESKPAKEILDSIKAAGFRWHNQKKLWYAKQTAERMALAEKLSEAQPVDAPVLAVPASEPVSKFGIKVGDILTGSWGYSMTLVEMYKVTKIVSPCRIEIVEIGADLVSADRGGGENLLPNPEKVIGEPEIKNVIADRYSQQENAFYVKINNSCNLRPWSGHTLYRNTWD